MAHLALRPLGSFEAALDGGPVEGLNSKHLRALLAYLAIEQEREHSREQVASLLWPERSDQEALDALRFALSNLRGVLVDRRTVGDRNRAGDRRSTSPYLLVTRTHVQFNPASDHWLDVAEFEHLRGQPDTSSMETGGRALPRPLPGWPLNRG